jgi:chromosome segregation ATPase
MDTSITKESDAGSSVIEKEELEQQILDMSNELICLRERINDLESDLHGKSQDNEKYSDEIQVLRENLARKSTENIKIFEEIKELENHLEERSTEKIKYSRKIEELEEELEKTKTSPAAAVAPGDESAKIKELEGELKSFTLKANHLKMAKTNLEKSIQSYHDKINMLEGEGSFFIWCIFRRHF